MRDNWQWPKLVFEPVAWLLFVSFYGSEVMNDLCESRQPGHRFTRRQFGLAAFGTGVLLIAGLSGLRHGGTMLRRSAMRMGTEVNLILYGPDDDSCERAARRAFARMDALELILSRHNQGSELARLNREGRLPTASADLLKVMQEALMLSEKTEGAFDPTVLPLLGLYKKQGDQWQAPAPAEVEAALTLVGYANVRIEGEAISYAIPGMGVTLDGIGKGYAVDQAVLALAEIGFTDVYVEAGGDLMVSGTKADGEPWRIGVANPRPEHPREMITIVLKDQAIATSGDYMQAFTPDRRFHHIVDPKNGFSPPELASASVIAPEVMIADGLATAAMVLGHERATAILDTMEGCEALFIDKDLGQYLTSGFHTLQA
ncbi:MAG: twin-arginine translocation pathway signal protein [Desulfobulbus propionicus]|nr:MAG: twin-arginine translocation pathway signal protein [Desulfobulbus propionicus]